MRVASLRGGLRWSRITYNAMFNVYIAASV